MDPVLQSLVYNASSCTNYDIAALTHFLLKDEFVCAKLKLKLWYQYQDGLWHRTETGPYNFISTVVAACVEQYLEVVQPQDKDPFEKLIRTLKSAKEKEGICKECMYLFYDPDFIYKLDRKKNLISFQNGVYDMCTSTFRNGTSEDNLSLYIDEQFDGESESLFNLITRFNRFRESILTSRKPKHVFCAEDI